MSQRYLGGVITANPTTPTLASLSGVWTLEQQFQNFNVWSPKIVGNSVRFRSSASANLQRTFVSSNRKTWTWSGWVKRGLLANRQGLFSAGLISGTFHYHTIHFDSNDKLNVVFYPDTTSTTLITTQVFRDPSAWYHLVVAFDTTQATAANRVKVYVNGSQVTAFDTASYSAQNTDGYINSTTYNSGVHYIGRFTPSDTAYLDGYLGEINFIDGQALTPSSFGALDSTGVWQPLPYTGTYGTNGYYLTFSDNSAATAAALGKDTSGNGNNWTPNNISLTAGVTYDWMLDSPTNWTNGTGNGVANYCTLNPANRQTGSSAAVLANGNLTITVPSGVNATPGAYAVATGTFLLAGGKWYFEAVGQQVSGSGGGHALGVTNALTFNFNGTNYYTSSFSNVSKSASAAADVLMIAYDADNNLAWVGKNGTWDAGNPSAGTGGTSYTGPVIPFAQGYNDTTNRVDVNCNFGQRSYTYTPPTGFKALNTLNLPDPTIMNGASYMAATTYTGNGGTQTVANSGGFAPDFVWIKNRGTVTDHGLFDTVRGATKRLSSNLANAETTEVNSLTAFTSTGFTVGATQDFNQNTIGLVGWQWKEGVPQGFDIVAYTGDGTSPRNISHNLGVAPAMVIVKSRGAVASWMVKHKNLSANNNLFLESTSAQSTPSNGYIQDLSSSSTFGVVNGGGGVANVNTNGTTYIAYCFAPVTGYSAFGSYTGNGSTDGPFVFLGFRPRFVMIKRTDTAEAWTIVDTSRTTSNTNSVQYLIPNSSGAEFTDTNSDYDILSNGLKFRDSGSLSNGSGGTYIYAAFAENPFKIARAR